MFVQKMIKIFVWQKTVMNISLGQVVSLYVFTCIVIILENRPVGASLEVWRESEEKLPSASGVGYL